jgi:hypothetical protein
MIAFDRLVAALEQHDSKVTGSGSDRMAQCPAHGDRNPSLSLTACTDRVLVKCHAGCDTLAVLGALGLTSADLFNQIRSNGKARQIVATYDYTDEVGTMLFQVVRFEPKGFQQRKPDGRGGWTWKLGDTRRVLYRLPQVLDAARAGQTVYVVEGEKDALAVERNGGVATCNSGGAGSWMPQYSDALKGAKVIVVADLDTPGRAHACRVVAALLHAGITARLVEPMAGKDVTDHLAAGHGLDELVPVEPLEVTVEGVVVDLTPSAGDATADPEFDAEIAAELRKLKVRQAAKEAFRADSEPPAPTFDAGTLAEILARPAKPPMRVEGMIPWDASTLFVAMRKTGKTTVVLNLIRSLLTGEAFLGTYAVIPVKGAIAILNYEVSASMLARWADDHGIDRERLYLVNLRNRRNPLSHADDRARLAADLRSRGVESLIVDPFGRAYTGKNQFDPGEVSGFLMDLDLFARSEAGAKDVVLTTHAGWTGERSRGSSALEDWADSIVTVTRDSKDESQRFLHAMGRDVEIEEDRLDFDAVTRTLRMSGTGPRKKRVDDRRNADLDALVLRAVHGEPGIGVAQLVEAIRIMDGAPTFRDGDVSKAAKRLEKLGHLRIKSGGPGTKSCHFATPSNPFQPVPGQYTQTPSTPFYKEGVGLGSGAHPLPPAVVGVSLDQGVG